MQRLYTKKIYEIDYILNTKYHTKKTHECKNPIQNIAHVFICAKKIYFWSAKNNRQL